jgi:hypothetical protein
MHDEGNSEEEKKNLHVSTQHVDKNDNLSPDSEGPMLPPLLHSSCRSTHRHETVRKNRNARHNCQFWITDKEAGSPFKEDPVHALTMIRTQRNYTHSSKCTAIPHYVVHS